MFWIWVFIIIGILAVCLDSWIGKIVIGCSVIAIGLLLLKWITGASILISLAKLCAIIIVVVIVGYIVVAIFGS